MKMVKRSLIFNLLCVCLLALAVCAGLRRNGGADRAPGAAPRATPIDKLARDLRDKVHGAPESRVGIILQTNQASADEVTALLKKYDARENRRFEHFDTVAVEVSARSVESLAAHREVAFMSLDSEVVKLGHVETTTGAAAARKISGNSSFDGSDIGIAVIDSSVFNSHTSFLDNNGNKRVAVDRDFTGSGSSGMADDPYGHGTHVASLAAGSARVVNAATGAHYAGVAPNAKIINLRVLNTQGRGKTSWLLGALDWVMTNRGAYNIKIVNLSLGAPAIESYKNDPLLYGDGVLYGDTFTEALSILINGDKTAAMR